jgi:hypothetical protein
MFVCRRAGGAIWVTAFSLFLFPSYINTAKLCLCPSSRGRWDVACGIECPVRYGWSQRTTQGAASTLLSGGAKWNVDPASSLFVPTAQRKERGR